VEEVQTGSHALLSEHPRTPGGNMQSLFRKSTAWQLLLLAECRISIKMCHHEMGPCLFGVYRKAEAQEILSLD
jgi:hypothetical protein